MDRDSFNHAFDHAMLYEVGAFWNPNDPDVIAGKIDTREQRKKVGYVNIPSDRGGETKFGVAQKANPQISVYNLDLNGAMDCYYNLYWLRGSNDKLSYPISLIHFDGCVNHGIGRANKFLQRAVGAVEDGQIGPATLRAVNAMDKGKLIQNIADIRANFYSSIVQRDPSQQMFLKGWMRRINEVRDFTLASLQ